MRLFVAIYPDKNLHEYFRKFRQDLSKYKRNFKFVEIDQIHMTVKFLGNKVSMDDFEIYYQRFLDLSGGFPKFEYSVQKPTFGFHTGELIPRLVLSKVNKNESLDGITKLANRAAKDISSFEIIRRQEHRKLIHHFTLARSKSNINKAFGREFREVLSKFEPPEDLAVASEIAIVDSTLSNSGPIHKKLISIKLK